MVETLVESPVTKPVRRRTLAFFWRIVSGFAGFLRGLFGSVVVLLSLAILAAVPGLQIWVLGYMLETSGRLATGGGWGSLLPGTRQAARLGMWLIVLGAMSIPSYALFHEASSAELISAGSSDAETLRRIGRVLAIVLGLHFLLAVLRGGTFWDFLRPIRNVRWFVNGLFRSSWYRERGMALREVWHEWRVGPRLSLGVRAYLGTFAWLFAPSYLMRFGADYPVVGILTVVLMAWVVTYLPVLQMRLVVEDRWTVFTEVRKTKQWRQRAPLSFALATTVWVLLSIPFHLLQVEQFPYGFLWVPGLVYVLLVLPGRWVAGLAMRRALSRQSRGGWWVRWPSWWLTYAAGLLYSTVVFFSPYIAFRGKWSLLEHHAFLFPILG